MSTWDDKPNDYQHALLVIERLSTINAGLVEVLEAVVTDILEYERVNNLAPNPGKQDCWQSVTQARAALAKAKEEI